MPIVATPTFRIIPSGPQTVRLLSIWSGTVDSTGSQFTSDQVGVSSGVIDRTAWIFDISQFVEFSTQIQSVTMGLTVDVVNGANVEVNAWSIGAYAEELFGADPRNDDAATMYSRCSLANELVAKYVVGTGELRTTGNKSLVFNENGRAFLQNLIGTDTIMALAITLDDDIGSSGEEAIATISPYTFVDAGQPFLDVTFVAT